MSGDVITSFGLTVRKLRVAKGLSQEALAGEASLDRAFLSQIETGKKQPSLLTIYKLSKALDLNVSDLFKQMERQL